MCICLCVCTYMFADILSNLNWALESLELVLKAVVSCLLWVLGTKPKSSAEKALKEIFRMKQLRIIEDFTKCRESRHLENTELWGQGGGSATEHMFARVIPCIQSPALTNKRGED